jgi:hypothetical protein
MAVFNMDQKIDNDENSASRSSKDTVINTFGRSLLNLCYLLDCLILNGYCPGDNEGEFTFVSPNGSSVIDYFIMSEDLFAAHKCSMHVGNRVDS